MSEYRVNFTEVPAECVDDETYGGVLIHIRPPVQLNPDAVERYLSFKDFEPVNRNSTNADIKDVVVLGSTPEQTTIYASVTREFEGVAQEAAEKTVKLLRFMGAQAIIGNPPTSEA
jgi:hypothetical protein